jgi:hypothetical protein
MGRRALIVGIEEYARVSDGSIAARLDGTLKSAQDFQTWLIAKWDAEGVLAADRQIIFCSEPTVAGGRHATAEDLTQALLDLKAAGQGSTSELFFYFSGHGFSYVQPDARSDVLIASNYKSMDLSGSACLLLDKAIYWLRQHLGPGHQYYFVDACRNDLDGRRINPGGVVPPSDPQTSDEATTFLLQSTAPSATAAVDGRFAASLLAGLNGMSTAKMWDEAAADTMLVRFDSLRGFVRERMKPQRVHNAVAGSDGETDAIILRLKPPPTSKFTVRIEGADVPAGTITSTGKRAAARIDIPIAGESTTFELKPDRYTISVQVPGAEVQDNGREVVVFDDAAATFHCGPAGAATTESADIAIGPGAPGVAAATETGNVTIPKNLTLELKDFTTGLREVFNDTETVAVPRGRYSAKLINRNNQVLNRHVLSIEPKETVSLTGWPGGAPQETLARQFHAHDGVVDFSESLGPLAEPDLNVWLAIVGGGKILAGSPSTDFSKIGPLPLQDFSRAPPGSSPVYVLIGQDDPAVPIAVAAAKQPSSPHWIAAAEPQGLPGIKQAVFWSVSGPFLLSLRSGHGAPYTIASATSPNRATLVTATFDHLGTPTISQYLLPIGHLVPLLEPAVAELVGSRNQLRDLKVLAEAQRAFKNRRDIARDVSASFVTEVLERKWLDPIAAAMVGYELIRRGRADQLSLMVHNMATYFPELPDSMALAKLSGVGAAAPLHGVPLFFDGLRAFGDDRLPLPETALDYNSVWTAWRGDLG